MHLAPPGAVWASLLGALVFGGMTGAAAAQDEVTFVVKTNVEGMGERFVSVGVSPPPLVAPDAVTVPFNVLGWTTVVNSCPDDPDRMRPPGRIVRFNEFPRLADVAPSSILNAFPDGWDVASFAVPARTRQARICVWRVAADRTFPYGTYVSPPLSRDVSIVVPRPRPRAWRACRDVSEITFGIRAYRGVTCALARRIAEAFQYQPGADEDRRSVVLGWQCTNRSGSVSCRSGTRRVTFRSL